MIKLSNEQALQRYFTGFYVKCASYGVNPDAVLQAINLMEVRPDLLTPAVTAPVVKAAMEHGFGDVMVKHAQGATVAPTAEPGFWSRLGGSIAKPFVQGVQQIGQGVTNMNPMQAIGGIYDTATAPVQALTGGAAEASKGVPGLQQVTDVANTAVGGALDAGGSAVRGDLNGALGGALNTGTKTVQNATNAVPSAIKQVATGKPAIQGNTRTIAPQAKPGTAIKPVTKSVNAPSFAPQTAAPAAKPAAPKVNVVDGSKFKPHEDTPNNSMTSSEFAKMETANRQNNQIPTEPMNQTVQPGISPEERRRRMANAQPVNAGGAFENLPGVMQDAGNWAMDKAKKYGPMALNTVMNPAGAAGGALGQAAGNAMPAGTMQMAGQAAGNAALSTATGGMAPAMRTGWNALKGGLKGAWNGATGQ